MNENSFSKCSKLSPIMFSRVSKSLLYNYKDFVGGLEGVEAAGLTSPKRKKSQAPLKGPSRTRLAAQKKIQAARTKRLCSPPPPTRTVSTLSLPIPVVNTAATSEHRGHGGGSNSAVSEYGCRTTDYRRSTCIN